MTPRRDSSRRSYLIRIICSLAMVVAGVLLLLALPRDRWPVAVFAYLALCSLVGSCVGQQVSGSAPVLAFLLSWALASILFPLGGSLLDVCARGRLALGDYARWWLMVVVFASLYSLAGTLSVFPVVRLVKRVIQA
jgi:hypothetical protein